MTHSFRLEVKKKEIQCKSACIFCCCTCVPFFFFLGLHSQTMEFFEEGDFLKAAGFFLFHAILMLRCVRIGVRAYSTGTQCLFNNKLVPGRMHVEQEKAVSLSVPWVWCECVCALFLLNERQTLTKEVWVS